MKKAKWYTLAVAAVLALSMVAFAACGGKGGDDGKVSDKEWAHYFSLVNVETNKSITLEKKEGNTYGKDKAEEYGEWDTSTLVSKIDKENEVIEQHETREYYNADAEGTNKFETHEDTDYYFAYNGKYYHWSKYDRQTASVEEITKARFTQLIEDMSNQYSMIQTYAQPAMKKMFKYNSDTKTYEMVQMGTMTIGFRFLEDDAFTYIMQENTLSSYEVTLRNVNKTTATVPNEVKAEVDAFIAAQA